MSYVGSQQSTELKDALDSEMEKTKIMEQSMKKLDQEMKKGDELLAQMIPAAVADKMKSGASPVDTCEVFEMVTIVFNNIPEFVDICTKCDGMQIVEMLNTMFGIFDVLSERNDIYKVETVKDSFVGVSGAPEKTKNHAEKVMDMALDMRDSVAFVKDPRPEFADQEVGISLCNSILLTCTTCILKFRMDMLRFNWVVTVDLLLLVLLEIKLPDIVYLVMP